MYIKEKQVHVVQVKKPCLFGITAWLNRLEVWIPQPVDQYGRSLHLDSRLYWKVLMSKVWLTGKEAISLYVCATLDLNEALWEQKNIRYKETAECLPMSAGFYKTICCWCAIRCSRICHYRLASMLVTLNVGRGHQLEHEQEISL